MSLCSSADATATMSRQKIDIKKPSKTEKVLINSKHHSKESSSSYSPKVQKRGSKSAFRDSSGVFSVLPRERIVSILIFLDPQSVCRFGNTNHSLKAISEDNKVWKYRLKPPERSEQNGSKEHVDIPAKIQYMRTFSQWSLWAHCGFASKFMRNWSSQSSLTTLVQVLNRPLRENSALRRAYAERVLENEIIQMLQEDDEWKPPVIGCVAIILLGIYGRTKEFPNLIPTVWRLLLETEVGDKIVPKLVVAAYFGDPNFKENALDFVKKAIKYIADSSGGSTEEEEEDEKQADAKSSNQQRRTSHTSRVGVALDLKSSRSHTMGVGISASSSAASQSDVSVKMQKKRRPSRRPSVKYVDVFCLQCAVLTVVEMLRDKGIVSNPKKILPPDIASLAEHHAYNRTAKAAKEWCQTIKENNTKLGLGQSKCVIL